MVKLVTKFAALSFTVFASIASAVDIQLCINAYYDNCDWKYDVPIGKCLNMVTLALTGLLDTTTSSRQFSVLRVLDCKGMSRVTVIIAKTYDGTAIPELTDSQIKDPLLGLDLQFNRVIISAFTHSVGFID
ncbi:uncharacterized protein BT62DRAFT_923603 [Guyanagaster necrorhizus]|uniref:Uncharacterized protein n=1 Tax=Guyanagaster necrorhizus TaxID=856835 RepID=A0A9P8AML0_9AGAR|nr:uncharacterized protein BT62DRAFT_923603 [Guyanagaster necrorhizus MCA 3950]KAG7441020.1 hypothetical protein BT62DRAFT_923603 [Guyanagaster necrorhizus MCA 3950]